MKKLTILLLMLTSAALGGCVDGEQNEEARMKVTNGQAEDNYPYVVRITMDSGGTCTGSFVSDSLLVTAAHCVDKAASLSWNGISTDKSNFFIHSGWPTVDSGCGLARQAKFDLALVRFPEKTYTGTEFARLLQRSPRENESFTIVGYGNSLIEPFETFCRLPPRANSDGACYVQRGSRVAGASYDYSSVFEFAPKVEFSKAGCPVECNTNTLRAELAREGSSYSEFLLNQCDGNFRDRSYRETGSGVKRSGSNVIARVLGGTIEFFGAIGGESTGIKSASGAGDSGGPLFIFRFGRPYLAALTHGGSLTTQDDEFSKRSIYVDLASPYNEAWLKQTVQSNRLNFPNLSE